MDNSLQNTKTTIYFQGLIIVALLSASLNLIRLSSFPPSNNMIRLSLLLLWGGAIALGLFLVISISVRDKFENITHRIYARASIRTALMSAGLIMFIFGIFFRLFEQSSLSFIVEIYFARLLPLNDWMLTLGALLLFSVYITGYTNLLEFKNAFSLAALVFLPAVWVTMSWFAKVDYEFYVHINKEDHVVEWITFASIMGAGILSLILAAFEGKKPRSDRYTWFLILFGLAMIFFALEEISYGQRIYDIESTEFFLENSDQKEINLHNVFSWKTDIQTKTVASLGLLAYGIALPLLALIPPIRVLLNRMGILIPPLTLTIGIAVGAFLLNRDMGGKEEEVGEMILSLILLWLMVWALFVPQRDFKNNKFM